ncbi:hypothetical protein DICVIV_04370 [Dictyocaulus viviparus]|uniref:Uncharacterized protein n=1 Tax=Dictyocaulus viviparus TaxID=29172 RepID=A0A0D8Y4J9_DICVI|nr:hypothetical protein DICVIV_04370 [Dictyocaulus viviparus]
MSQERTPSQQKRARTSWLAEEKKLNLRNDMRLFVNINWVEYSGNNFSKRNLMNEQQNNNSPIVDPENK